MEENIKKIDKTEKEKIEEIQKQIFDEQMRLHPEIYKNGEN